MEKRDREGRQLGATRRRRGSDSFVYMRLHAARVYNDGGRAGLWGALPHIPSGLFFEALGARHTRVFPLRSSRGLSARDERRSDPIGACTRPRERLIM